MEELKRHKFIILCGDSINSLGLLRSLGEIGIVPYIILMDERYIKYLSISKYSKKILRSYSDEDSLSILVNRFGNEKYKPFVFTNDDGNTQLLNNHLNELTEHFYFFHCDNGNLYSTYLNKEAQCKMAISCGMCPPLSEVVTPGTLPKTLKYPIFTKTIDSVSPGWKKDVYICHNEQEFLDFSKNMTSPALLVQEYIEKIGELSMQGISINGGSEVFIPFERMYLRYTDTSFGGYMYYQPFKNEELKDKIISYIRKIKYSGCFEIEFLVDKNNDLKFLEVNLRFSASNYGVHIGGINQPILWAESTLSGKIITDKLNIAINRYYIMNDATDFQQIHKVGVRQWLKDLKRTQGYSLFNKKDIMPFINFWYKKIIKIALGKLKININK